MTIPFKYIGLIVEGRVNLGGRIFVIGVTKIKRKLARQKGRYLTYIGRICLIRLVIIVLPLYYLSFFKAPASICYEIIKIQRNFL